MRGVEKTLLRATFASFGIMVLSALIFGTVNVGIHMRKQAQLGLGALLGYTVLNPFLWLVAVAAFIVAFRYFVGHRGT